MTTAANTRLAESDMAPASVPAHTNKALDRLAQHRRDQARMAALEEAPRSICDSDQAYQLNAYLNDLAGMARADANRQAAIKRARAQLAKDPTHYE
jgi:molybdopterin biosynthesis enzyme